ncbi:MAG: hypothetical protein LBG44_07035 [Gemmatimonadota bacterium]|jgi:hypothetical protein|nr:hypothetical protein [Gemmatimonadota bacterium]
MVPGGVVPPRDELPDSVPPNPLPSDSTFPEPEPPDPVPPDSEPEPEPKEPEPKPKSLVRECEEPDDAWIWCDDFEADRLSQYYEYDRGGDSFVRQAAVGVGSSIGMRARYTRGREDAGSLKLAFGRTPSSYFRSVPGTEGKNYREIYWRVWVRNEPGWSGGGGDKFARLTVFAGSNWQQAAIGHVWSSGQGGNYLALDPASGTDAAGHVHTTRYNDFQHLRWLGIRRGSTPIFDERHVGVWHCVEAHMKLNDPELSPGHANGAQELWINGMPEASSTNLNWVGGYNEYGINAFFLENFWNDGAPREQERYFDNLVVSTRRIGCGAAPQG